MILAGEAATTTTRDLDVYVHGTWSQMRLRNDNGDWSDWQPFANSFTWTIADGRGEHYVAAELRSGGTHALKLRHDHLGCACRRRRHGQCAQEALPARHPEWPDRLHLRVEHSMSQTEKRIRERQGHGYPCPLFVRQEIAAHLFQW